MSETYETAADGLRALREGTHPFAKKVPERKRVKGRCDRTDDAPYLQRSVPKPIHFTSQQLPRNWRNARTGEMYASDYDEKGRPRFSSKKEVREAVARHNGEQDEMEMSYGELPDDD